MRWSPRLEMDEFTRDSVLFYTIEDIKNFDTNGI